ncbi:MAG: mandelate racemase/muconate lactonizing enzyme family protein [Verrucomicrobia bacterium]|nr:mandelate racemase/muconate lactonizing enzyme family protein [Verrucomicrobiota bacterium]
MGISTDIRTVSTSLYFLPVQTRVPLKFGRETLTSVTCARARVTVADHAGRSAEGWGETPLSVQWVWPGAVSYEERHAALQTFSLQLAELWSSITVAGHPLEIGYDFQQTVLPGILDGFNRRGRSRREPMPWLAALLCCAPFDIALHDAYGKLHGLPVYETYGPEFVNRDLASFLQPAAGARVSFRGKFPKDFLVSKPAERLRAWHLVGGLDPLDASELTGGEPSDGYPVTLEEWIERDGLSCLKVKLRGNDADWDYRRLVKVGQIAIARGVDWLSADFNCTVQEPDYVNAILDRLRDEHARVYGMILYVEQPFPYELEQHPIDVRSVAARKPLFLDESAHDWKQVRLGRELGWTGVALKTCKTQTGALLSACWARAHGMSLMVQDLTNPMLAQIPHVLLAANVGTIMGVETNAMQFYPEASQAEAAVHPGLYQRRHGELKLATARGPGFGYRLEEIKRALPDAAVVCEG